MLPEKASSHTSSNQETHMVNRPSAQETQQPSPEPNHALESDAPAPEPQPTRHAAQQNEPPPGSAATATEADNTSTGDSEQAETTEAPATKEALAAAATEALHQQLLRLGADFDNYRKRTRHEILNAAQGGIDKLALDVVPVIDNLKRALDHADEASDAASIIDGVKMVHKQMTDALADHNIIGFDCIGQPFDPKRHEAVGHQPSTHIPAEHVCAELQRGYTSAGKLLKPSLVIVAKPEKDEKPT
jgi:molecular chaperone GrpE